jgi:hypothetical protein
MRTTNEINKLGPRRHDLSKRRTFGICPALENLRLTIADHCCPVRFSARINKCIGNNA